VADLFAAAHAGLLAHGLHPPVLGCHNESRPMEVEGDVSRPFRATGIAHERGTRLKILLSAFACSPGVGSEGGCGWKYAARLSDDHEVWVITDASRRAAIEGDPLFRKSRLHFVFYRPRGVRNVKLNPRTALLVYEAWQMGAWRVAKRLDGRHDFDFVWHLTYGSFRHPSRYWRVGKPFVFGPLAGGETSPQGLRRGLARRDQAKEWYRDACNKLVLARPALRATYRHSTLVISRTEDTRAAIPRRARKDSPIQENIGAYAFDKIQRGSRDANGPLRALFVGRLVWWKGIHLAIRAIGAAREQGSSVTLTIIGSGPVERSLRALVASLDLADSVTFVKQVEQGELFRRYADYDVLLFPSLHDSGGNVVLEALSHALPVICLDLGGPPTFVDERCGVIVPSRKGNTTEVAAALGSALVRLERNPDILQSLGDQAVLRAAELTWDKQIERCLDLVEKYALNRAG